MTPTAITSCVNMCSEFPQAFGNNPGAAQAIQAIKSGSDYYYIPYSQANQGLAKTCGDGGMRVYQYTSSLSSIHKVTSFGAFNPSGPLATPDYSSGFTTGFILCLTVKHDSNGGTAELYVDNLCCVAAMRCTSGTQFEANLSGASFAFPPSDISPPSCNSAVPGPGVPYDDYCRCWAAIQATNGINAANSGGNLATINLPGTTIMSPSYAHDFIGYGYISAITNNSPSRILASISPSSTYFQGKCSATLTITIDVRLDSGAFADALRSTAVYACSDFHCDSSSIFTLSSKTTTYGTYSPSGCGASGGGARTWTLPDCDATNLFVFPGSITVSPI